MAYDKPMLKLGEVLRGKDPDYGKNQYWLVVNVYEYSKDCPGYWYYELQGTCSQEENTVVREGDLEYWDEEATGRLTRFPAEEWSFLRKIHFGKV